MVAREYGSVFILCWAHLNAHKWELHKNYFASAMLSPRIIQSLLKWGQLPASASFAAKVREGWSAWKKERRVRVGWRRERGERCFFRCFERLALEY